MRMEAEVLFLTPNGAWVTTLPCPLLPVWRVPVRKPLSVLYDPNFTFASRPVFDIREFVRIGASTYEERA